MEKICENCAYMFKQSEKITYCFYHHFSFKNGAIVGCDKWETNNIIDQISNQMRRFFKR